MALRRFRNGPWSRWLKLIRTVRERPAHCDACPLSSCETGRCATVVAVTCVALDAHRLRTLGVYEGARVNVVDRRSGVLLDVCGTRLALNDTLAALILVRPATA